ncbi:MAG TPA: homogentisate 1,2-dioxygenase [candidate division Zixibacteria bacterium]|nr:homogentisate 1,2-dioxygenase [candidate division Zixibacteria bacterium]
MRYVQLGDVPVKHHIQFKQPDGTLYKEQLFGTQGFSGRSSTMYHIHLPTCVSEIERIGERRLEAVPDDMLKHRHLKTRSFQAQGDAVSGRIPLCFNNDVILAYARTTDRMSYFFKNADGDEALYIHQGSGRLESMFGTLSYTSGDYLIIPRGTIYRLVEETVDTEIFVVESLSPIEIPRRYRNEYGQLLEHAPYRERDIRVPDTLETHRKDGRYKVRILARGIFHDYYYDFHPFDIVGWDGYVYPWAFNIHNYQPITGLVHMPPPTHQTFEAHNYIICSFVPRMLDYHPDAVPAPYHHSNIDSDEVIYYANDKFGSRRGIEEGSVTVHPSGIPHGPQPGATEASIGVKETKELAVMVDTFHPLQITKQALEVEDPTYAMSWKG